MTRALQDIRVIDFTQVLAGPFAAQQLAQLGADVIKIEHPKGGDMTRGSLISSGRAPGMAPSFLTCNIGKRSVALDLKAPAARDIVQRLVASADAILENFKPGVMLRLGFDYPQLKSIKPDLVYCSISGYGQTGPIAEQPAFDGAIQAASGMMAISGHPESGPTRAGYFAVDMSTAINAAFATTAALLRRERTGEGQHIDVAMMDTALLMQAPQMTGYFATGSQPALLGNQSPTRQPTANVFATADGHIQIIALKQPQVTRLLEVLGEAALLLDSRFATGKVRIENAAALNERLAPILLRQPTQFWMDELRDNDIPCAQIRSLAAVADDPQFDHRTVFDQTTLDHPVVAGGHVANQDGPQTLRPAPKHGEHSREVLGEVGFSAVEIDGFFETGSIV